MKILKKLIGRIKFYFNHYSPYCKLCSSCGESGCCSPLSCMYKCMVDKNPQKCKYGYGYAKDLHFGYKLANFYEDEIEKLRNKEITVEDFLERTDAGWDGIYDEIFLKKINDRQ